MGNRKHFYRRRAMKKLVNISIVLLFSILLSSCSIDNKPRYTPPTEPEKYKIVTTTFPIYDFVRQLTKGCDIEVYLLVPPR